MADDFDDYFFLKNAWKGLRIKINSAAKIQGRLLITDLWPWSMAHKNYFLLMHHVW